MDTQAASQYEPHTSIPTGLLYAAPFPSNIIHTLKFTAVSESPPWLQKNNRFVSRDWLVMRLQHHKRNTNNRKQVYFSRQGCSATMLLSRRHVSFTTFDCLFSLPVLHIEWGLRKKRCLLRPSDAGERGTLFTLLHSQNPFGRGQPCHIWSRNTYFKGCSRWTGPRWINTHQHRLGDARPGDSSSLLIELHHRMQNPHPSLHIIRRALISHVFYMNRLSQLCRRAIAGQLSFLYYVYATHEYGRQYSLRSHDWFLLTGVIVWTEPVWDGCLWRRRQRRFLLM